MISNAEIIQDIERRQWTLYEAQINDNYPDIFFAAIFGVAGRDKMADGYRLRVHSDLHPTPDRAMQQVYGIALKENAS